MTKEELAQKLASYLVEKSDEPKYDAPWVNTDDLHDCIIDGHLDLIDFAEYILAILY